MPMWNVGKTIEGKMILEKKNGVMLVIPGAGECNGVKLTRTATNSCVLEC